jgi:hypothetical protein
MLLLCPRPEVSSSFFPDFNTRGASTLADLWATQCGNYEETTIVTTITWNIWKRKNDRTFTGIVEETPWSLVDVLRTLGFGHIVVPPPLAPPLLIIGATGSTRLEPPLPLPSLSL